MSSMKRRFSNLYFVASPTFSTTSLAYYLGQHSDVFVPLVKEASYFGRDLAKCGPGGRTLGY